MLGVGVHDWGFTSGLPRYRRTLDFERARVIGGCSSHNGCAAIWGAPRRLRRVGRGGQRRLVDRRAAAVLPARQRADARAPTPLADLTPYQRAAMDALIAMGIPATDDLNDLDEPQGVSPSPVNIDDGVRFNTAFAYLDPVRHRPNLTIVGDALADRLLVEGSRVRRRRGDRRRPPRGGPGRPHDRLRRCLRLARHPGALGHRRSAGAGAARDQGHARPRGRRREPARPSRRRPVLHRHRRARPADGGARAGRLLPRGAGDRQGALAARAGGLRPPRLPGRRAVAGRGRRRLLLRAAGGMHDAAVAWHLPHRVGRSGGAPGRRPRVPDRPGGPRRRRAAGGPRLRAGDGGAGAVRLADRRGGVGARRRSLEVLDPLLPPGRHLQDGPRLGSRLRGRRARPPPRPRGWLRGRLRDHPARPRARTPTSPPCSSASASSPGSREDRDGRRIRLRRRRRRHRRRRGRRAPQRGPERLGVPPRVGPDGCRVRRRPADPSLARAARGADRPRLPHDPAAAGQRAHRPLPGEGARRLLVAQHDDLVQAVPGRLERLGRGGLRGLVERRDGSVLRADPRPARPRRRGRPQRDPVRLDRRLRHRPRRHEERRLERGARTATAPASSTSATTRTPASARRRR